MVDFKLDIQSMIEAEEEPDLLDELMAETAGASESSPETPLGEQESSPEEPVVPQVPQVAVAPPPSPKPRRQGPGTKRRRVTAIDAALLGFMGKFRVVDAVTLSYLQLAGLNPRSKEVGAGLMSPITVATRLKKLQSMGLVSRHRTPFEGKVVWGTNEDGVTVARDFGYLQDDAEVCGEGPNGLSYRAIPHAISVARVAAQFASPAGLFRESLGLEPVTQAQLVSETTLRRGQQASRDVLFENKKRGLSGDFGALRNKVLVKAQREIEEGVLEWEDLLLFYPELWTMGEPAGEVPTRQSHWADLVISREAGRGATPRSIAVEIELSAKPNDDYLTLLRTFARELRKPVYERVVYFTTIPGLEERLKKLDRVGGFGLFQSRRLAVLPLLDRDGSVLRFKKEIMK